MAHVNQSIHLDYLGVVAVNPLDIGNEFFFIVIEISPFLDGFGMRDHSCGSLDDFCERICVKKGFPMDGFNANVRICRF